MAFPCLSVSIVVDNLTIALMTKRCAALHCAEPVAGYSTLCESHKRTLRRHGHALQKGITVLELKPFQDRIAARRSKNPDTTT